MKVSQVNNTTLFSISTIAMASFTTSSSSSLLLKTLLPVSHLNRFSTLSGIRVGERWTPLLRSISTAGSRRRVAIVKAATVDSDYSSKRSSSNEQRETIMLPGCDYNHWLTVMEFPKDPAPTREQMIDTYLNTLATVLGRFVFALLLILFVVELVS